MSVGLWSFLVCLESFVLIMILVAFFILCERKFLGYIQFRKGPNKVGLVGLLQSFADLLKLVVKSKGGFYMWRSWLGFFGLVLLLFSSMFFSYIYGVWSVGLSYNYWFLYFLVLSSILSYGLLMIGWGGWGKYGLLGGIRSSFASVSFEALLMCVVLIVGVVYNDYGVAYNSFLFVLVPVCYLVWWGGVLGESNRSPFDYGESESELVSGINTEYSGVPFVAIFACEYLMLYIFSWLTSVVFFSYYFGFIILHLVLYIWFRGTFPRVRYDCYVSLLWEYGLLLVLLSLLLLYGNF